jgi:hypothetical protein
MESTAVSESQFRMEGSLKRILIVYAGAFFLGLVFLYFYVTIMMRVGNYTTLILVIPLYAYVFRDLVVWMRNGIRIVEIDPGGMSIVRRLQRSQSRIDVHEISAVHVSRMLDRTVVKILLPGSTVGRWLWFNRYKGPRVVITEEPFDKKEFAEFVRRVTDLGHTAQRQRTP